jgi:putative transcriptional regulator
MATGQQEILKKLGQRVKALREQRGLTLKEMGYKIDKDPQSISRLEMGKINPSYLYLLDICSGLDIDIAEILKD